MSFVYRMKIRKYLPDKMYGFASSEEGNIFFHLSVFKSPIESIDVPPPPPVVGEEIDVILETPLGQDLTPRATRVQRIQKMVQMEGTVEFFNSKRGYGKITTPNGDEYFLHRSEVKDGKMPLAGHQVHFFAINLGHQTKPRACHVDIRS